MSVYNPPNFEEYLSVFNPANWLPPSAGEIDTAYLDANYLRFPFAQGSENLLNTTINGNLALTGGITFSDASVMKSLGYISIVSYGADPTGVADSTTAIQNAVNALTLTNNTLFIPRGRYLISSTILIQNKQNCNIFSEGCLYCNTLITMIGITNVYNFSINGSLILDGVSSATGATGIDIYNTAGGYITSDSVNQLNINGLLLTNLGYGAECRAIGFPSKLFSNFQISNCSTGLRVRGEYFQFANINIFACGIGILNYGGNNTYTDGIIKTCNYGLIVNNNPALAGNPDHNGCYGITFNHNVNCAIILSYINLSWVIENCNFWANVGSTLGNPLGDNSIVAPSYQGYGCGGVYIQGASKVNVSNNIFGFNENTAIALNGVNNSSIVNNTILQTVPGYKYISVVGAYLYNANAQNVIANNNFSGLTATTPSVSFDTAVHSYDFLYSNTTSTTIQANVGNSVVSTIDNTITGNVYIDGTSDVYTIVEGTTATIYITNTIGTRFSINYRRTGSYTFTSAPSTTTVKILKPVSPLQPIGFATPVICDGLFLNSDDGAGNRVIQFQKEGMYIFEPTVNNPTLLAGNYTIRPVFADANLYYSVALGASSIDLRSALFFNSDVNIIDGVGSPNTTILLQSSSLTGGNAFYIGSRIKIFNDSSSVLTLSGTGGVFSGAYGNGASTISVPDNTWVVVLFDGTNYLINERSANVSFQLTGISAGVSYVNNFNLTNATVNLSLTSAGLVNIPIPSATRSHQTTTIFNNIGVHQFTLQISSGIFSGNYGSGGTQLIVPVGCWVQIYSDATNWRVDDRSSNFNINLYSATTAFDWSSNYQYLDNQIDLVPADDALNTGANITGGGTMSGYVFTFVSLSGTGLGAGSIFSVNTSSTRKYTILCQVGGTLGGLGSYLCNFAGDFPTTVAITMRPNLTTNTNGFFTQGALTTQTGIYSTATFTTGTPFAGMTVGIPTATVMGNIPFYVINQNSGTSWFVSSNSTGILASTAWWGNRGNTITLPNPSASLIGRTFTLINNSGTMTNITSSSGTALFGGRYGQMILNTATVASNYPVGAFPTNYLLRPNQTVVLRCDGTQWETIEGTSLGEQRAYCNNITASTSTADGTVANYPLYNYDQTYSNLSGLINITNGSSPAWCNLFAFPITLQLTFSFTWASVAVAGTTLPSRNIIITCYGAGINGFVSTNINTLTIPCTVASPNFTTILGDNIQYYTATITLRSFEVFVVQISKRDGSGTARTTGFSSMFVKRLA
jgi:hypothetical protein